MQPREISTIDIQMSVLVHAFQSLISMRQDALQCFCDQGVQVEGWLKGEVLLWLTKEKAAGRIQGFDREVLSGAGRKKVDIKLLLPSHGGSVDIWLELKHYLIGFQRNTRYEARAYFTDPTSGIKPDVDKLAVINTVTRYLLILATANPGSIGWLEAVQGFNQKFLPLYLHSLTNPDDFPPTFFLGLLRVAKAVEA